MPTMDFGRLIPGLYYCIEPHIFEGASPEIDIHPHYFSVVFFASLLAATTASVTLPVASPGPWLYSGVRPSFFSRPPKYQ